MVTATIGKNKYKTDLFATGHTLIADEPEDVGGGNTGPAPGQFLQLSLASCTAITLRMYADRKGWPLEKVKVEINMEKQGQESTIQRDIRLEGKLSDEQRQRLLQIANACPVHKTLSNPIHINTQLL